MGGAVNPCVFCGGELTHGHHGTDYPGDCSYPAGVTLMQRQAEYAAAVKEREGLRRSDARFQRKAARVADELANHIVKNGSLRYEVKRLEDVLAWACRTQQPLAEIRRVIARAVPRRIGRLPDEWHTDPPPDGSLLLASDSEGALRIAQERQRQIDIEGWTPEHDDTHTDGELVRAAACYLLAARAPYVLHEGERMPVAPPAQWPWSLDWWKPGTPLQSLTKAGALVAAEIDRLQRVHGG